MPRIRKKTSNRGTTHDRKKIQQKVAETHKKNKKKAKKDVTWRSNKRVDPGIPNNFPYKDQVLAEIADQRRQLEEDRLALKAANKGKRAKKTDDDGAEGSDDESDGEPVGQPGVSLVAGKRALEVPAKPKAARDDSPPPLLFDSDLPTLQAALERADVWLEVVDARDPIGSRSPWLEQLFETPDEGEKEARGRVVVVLTKIDLVPREALDQWLLYFRPRFPTILFKSFVPASNVPPPPASAVASSSTGFAPSEIVGKDALLAYLSTLAAAKAKKTPGDEFTVTLAGLPSVGKTSILNSLLAPAHGLPVCAYPQKSNQTRPTTTTPTGVAVALAGGLSIKCVDTPGWVFEDVFPEDVEAETGAELEEEEVEVLWEIVDDNRVKDLLRRNLGRLEKVKDAIPVAEYIIDHASPTDLQLLYSTAVHDTSDPESFLIALARATGRLKRGAAPDIEGAARALLRDWSLGFFPRYTLPPKGLTLDPRSPADLSTLKAFTEGEAELLARCPTRRELMRSAAGGRGVVKMRLDEAFEQEGGDIRAVVLDDEVREEEASNEDDDDDDEMGEDEEWTDDGEEVLPQEEDGEEPSDVEMDDDDEDDFAEGEIEDDDESAPSALDILLAANPTLVAGPSSTKKGKKAVPAPAPVPVAAPAPKKGKKTAAEPKRKVVFAGEKPATTPSETPKAPVSILKQAAAAAPAPPKKGKKAAAAAPAAATAAPAPVVAVGVPSKKEQRKRKATDVEPAAAAAPVKEAKKAKAAVKPATKKAAVATAPAAAAPVKSKAAARAEEKGEVPYTFDRFF